MQAIIIVSELPPSLEPQPSGEADAALGIGLAATAISVLGLLALLLVV